MVKKRILITPLEVGQGHKAPSMAIKKSIEKLYPGKYDVDVIDISRASGSKFAYAVNYHFWVNFALRFPAAQRILHKLTDNKFSRDVQCALIGGLTKKIKKYVEETKPDLILAPHAMYATALSKLKDELKIPLIGLDTDPFDVHYFWVSTNLDNFIVFSEKAKEVFVKRGVPANSIVVFNQAYPLDPKHSLKVDSQKVIRKKFGLTDKMTLLMSFGGEGVGNIKDYLMSVINNNLDMQVIVVCGRNEKIKNELDAIVLAKDSKTSLKTFGFVENMQEFLAASDLVLGKPGASQTFEILVKKKPIIYPSYMEQEHATLDFVVDNGYGWYTPKIKDFVELLKKIQQDHSMLKKASSKIKGIGICSDDVAKFLVEKLENER